MSFKSERQFRIWDYNFSHRQLLLRSPRTPEIATNIDIVFWFVEYVRLPTTLNGVVMTPAAAEDCDTLRRQFFQQSQDSSWYCLMTEGQRHYVAAAGFKILENELDVFDSSLEYFTAGVKNLGTELWRS